MSRASQEPNPLSLVRQDREHDRFDEGIRAVVRSGQGFSVLHTRDVSPGGVFLVTEGSFRVGERLRVKLAGVDGFDEVMVTAVVRHIVAPGPDRVAGVGVEFADLPASVELKLRRFLERWEPRGSRGQVNSI